MDVSKGIKPFSKKTRHSRKKLGSELFMAQL